MMTILQGRQRDEMEMWSRGFGGEFCSGTTSQDFPHQGQVDPLSLFQVHIIPIRVSDGWQLSEQERSSSVLFSTWDDFSQRSENKIVIHFPFFEARPLTSLDKIMCKTMFGKSSRGLIWA